MVAVTEVRRTADLPEYRERWSTLVDRAPVKDFFQTYEWLTCWLDAFWRGKPIAFLFVTEGSELVAVAPFLDDAAGQLWCGGSLVLPVNSHARRGGLIYTGALDEMLGAIFSHFQASRRRVRLGFAQVDQTSAVAQALPGAARPHGFSVMRYDCGGSPCARTDSGWETYLGLRSAHFRQEVRRKTRKCERAGVLEYVTVVDPARCPEALKDVMLIECNSWKEGEGSSISAAPGLLDFYTRLASHTASRGWLRIYLMYLDGRPVAYIYGVVFNNEYYALKTSFDADFRALSPGVALFCNAMKDAFQEGWRTFDFLGTDSRWKREWATHSRQYVDLCVFSAGMPRCESCRLYEHYVKPAIRKFPIAVSIKRNLATLRSQ